MLVKEHFCNSFLYRRPLRQDQLLDMIKSGAIFVYIQCDIKVAEHLRKSCQFPGTFQEHNIRRQL